jgi:hypothetical protein
LLDQEVFRKYLAGPERLGDVISGSGQTKTVILDEIQKVPSLLEEVHRLMELALGRQVQFILTSIFFGDVPLVHLLLCYFDTEKSGTNVHKKVDEWDVPKKVIGNMKLLLTSFI